MNDDNHIEIKPKKLKQFVIVKEYNGSYNTHKKTKREYTQKTILKERLSKPERDSLNLLERDARDARDARDDNFKYVTLIDLPSINEDNCDKNDNEQEKSFTTFKTLQKGALVSLLAVGGLVGAYTVFKNKGE